MSSSSVGWNRNPGGKLDLGSLLIIVSLNDFQKAYINRKIVFGEEQRDKKRSEPKIEIFRRAGCEGNLWCVDFCRLVLVCIIKKRD